MTTEPTPGWIRLVCALSDAEYADMESTPAAIAEIADAIEELITETVSATTTSQVNLLPKIRRTTMISLNNVHPAPKTVESYRVRKEAMDAAVFVIGPHARHGFEYETSKVDGRWIWHHTDEVRPDTPAQLKANGGKKSLMLASTPMAHIGAAKPVKLPVPPRRTPPQAQGKPAGAPDGAGGEQPPSNETLPSARKMPACNGLDVIDIIDGPVPAPAWAHIESLTQTPAQNLAADLTIYPDGSEGRIDTVPACNGLDIAKPDGLDLPTFLKRSPASAKYGNSTYDELKTSGALRSEPVAKPVGKPPVSRKAAKAKTAPKAAKRASKAPAKRAAASGGKTKTALIGELLSREGGCTTADILKATGWKAVNVPREGGKCGLKLKQKKDGGVTRYWAAA